MMLQDEDIFIKKGDNEYLIISHIKLIKKMILKINILHMKKLHFKCE